MASSLKMTSHGQIHPPRPVLHRLEKACSKQSMLDGNTNMQGVLVPATSKLCMMVYLARTHNNQDQNVRIRMTTLKHLEGCPFHYSIEWGGSALTTLVSCFAVAANSNDVVFCVDQICVADLVYEQQERRLRGLPIVTLHCVIAVTICI